MLQLYPEALDAEVARRREVAILTMRSGRGPRSGDRPELTVAWARLALFILTALVRRPVA